MRVPITPFESHVRAVVRATRARDDAKVRMHCRALAKLAAKKGHGSLERAGNCLAQRVAEFPSSSRERVDALLTLAFEVAEVGSTKHEHVSSME